MKRKHIGFGIALVVLMIAAIGCGGGETAPAATPKPAPTVAAATQEVSSSGETDFTVALLGTGGAGYAFDPETLTLQSGQSYSIELTGATSDEFHTWTLVDADGSYIQNVQVMAGESQTVELTAPAPGTYRLICLPHQLMGMEGEVVVN